MGDYVAAYTLYSSVRPFGSSTIIATMDKTGPKLYMVEPSGLYWVRRTIICVMEIRQKRKNKMQFFVDDNSDTHIGSLVGCHCSCNIGLPWNSHRKGSPGG